MQIFNTQQESDFARQYASEVLRLSCPNILLYKLDLDDTEWDKVRGDYTGSKEFEDFVISVPCFIDPQPDELLLDKFGINESRELVAIFAVDILKELETDVVAGDVIVFADREYDVKESKEQDWFMTSDEPINKYAFLSVRRRSTLRDNRIHPTNSGQQTPVAQDNSVDGIPDALDNSDESDIEVFY